MPPTTVKGVQKIRAQTWSKNVQKKARRMISDQASLSGTDSSLKNHSVLSQTSSIGTFQADSWLTKNEDLEDDQGLEQYYQMMNMNIPLPSVTLPVGTFGVQDGVNNVLPMQPQEKQSQSSVVHQGLNDSLQDILPQEEKTGEKKRFQVHAKSLHVTYSTHLPLEELLEFVLSQLNLSKTSLIWYSVVQENGTQSSTVPYQHTHLAFKARNQVSFSSQRKLDYNGIHPNIKVILNQGQEENVWNYHMKAPVMRIASSIGPVKDRGYYIAIQSAVSLIDACLLAGVEPKTVADISMIRLQKDVIKVVSKKFELSSFRFQLEDTSLTVWLHGPSGIGKTEWAIAQLEPALLVRHTEDLKLYMPSQHRGIVFDDFALEKLDISTIIHLFDTTRHSTINVKHGSVQIPEHTAKIFTSNRSIRSLLNTLNPIPEEDQIQAVLRRLYVISETQNMFL